MPEHFVWAYHVRIQNDGRDTVQLLTRHWMITDSQGHLHEVRGEGVVGKQPVLRPGEAFEYASGTPLATPSGIMMGTLSDAGAETARGSTSTSRRSRSTVRTTATIVH